ncbi:uncharacterized protein LOC127710067 [Mytilus californianus]|uniref:uncharacterized protein LOC127710067 n=1 Tax=Mytilus californianus TaxID=6549 RepID=UPI00224720C5|nr:uncharacterized protein LOC127710067 [Mytilus californianus]
MADDTINFVKLSVAILFFSDKLHGLIFERLLCENSDAELNCPVGKAIDDINITFNDEQDACSLTDDDYTGTIALNSTYYPSCIGHNSCVLTDKIVNFFSSVAVKTKKLFIEYHCVHEMNQHHNPKDARTVCPFNMESVKCGNRLRQIEIQSVELMQYSSFCENQNWDINCTDLIHQRLNTSCNGKQKCEPLIWKESISTWDDCIRIPKFVNISFSCIKAILPNIPLQDETNVVGVAVGVTVGLITIVGVIVVYIWFIRRKVTDDKQDITYHQDENKYNTGNENTEIPSDSNYEMLTADQESKSYDKLYLDFRQHSCRDHPDRNNKDIENEYIIPCQVTQKNKSKQTYEDQTVNHIELSIGTGIREQTQSSLSNSADYFIVLEPKGDQHVQHPNSNIYEMAKPINGNVMDK